MSGECDKCGEHASECKCELIEINKMRIENLKRQKFYLEKFFPWACGPYEDEDEANWNEFNPNDKRLENHSSYLVTDGIFVDKAYFDTHELLSSFWDWMHHNWTYASHTYCCSGKDDESFKEYVNKFLKQKSQLQNDTD